MSIKWHFSLSMWQFLFSVPTHCIFSAHAPVYFISRANVMVLPYHKGTELEIHKQPLPGQYLMTHTAFWVCFSLFLKKGTGWVVNLDCKAFNSWRRQKTPSSVPLVFHSVLQLDEVNAQVNQLIEKRMITYEPADSKFSMYRQQVRRNKRWFKQKKKNQSLIFSFDLSSILSRNT